MTKLRNIKTINNIINEFFYQLGYEELTCFLDNSFAYYSNDMISYSLIEAPIVDFIFKTYIDTTYPFHYDCSVFMLSLLHEIGHHITLNDINPKVLRKCRKTKQIIDRQCRKSQSDKIALQYKYCKLYDERIATKEAIFLLQENYTLIQKYEQKIFKAIDNFYNINNIIT